MTPRRAQLQRLPVALGFAVAVALAVFAAARAAPPFAALEHRARDLVQASFEPARPTRDDIVIVLIDETTLSTLPYRSPIDRGFLAELIGSLRAHDPRAIGIDLLIDQATEPEKDAAFLAAARAEAGAPVVLAAADEADGLLPAQARFLAAAAEGVRIGQAALLRDPYDFVTRATPDARPVNGRPAPTLSAALARAGGVDAPDAGFEIAFTPSPPGADFAPRLIAGFHRFFEASAIRDRFVLIGVDLDGIDRHRTPLDAASAADDRPGVESHAQALAQILDGRRLEEAGAGAELTLTLAAALVVTGALFAPAAVAVRLALAAAALVVFAALPAAALSAAHMRAPVVPPLAAGLITGGGVALARWRAEALTRRRLREAFGRYVSPAVVREIEARPEALALGGARREITCVFTDVAGFTTLCEALPADELIRLLNRYLGGASKIVVDHGGTIDKFVGDAIVGFFGAPIDRPDHAAAAIRMAVALDAFATSFAAEEARAGRPFGVTRIGVHTGDATVGNFGGDVFFDYTAMGDTVNVAARLEGANKAYGGRVSISGDALARAGGAVAGVLTRPVGKLRVKGRAAPLETYEAFGPDDPRAPTLPAYAAAMAEADPAARAAALARLAAEFPDDGLIALQAARAAAGDTAEIFTLKEK